MPGAFYCPIHHRRLCESGVSFRDIIYVCKGRKKGLLIGEDKKPALCSEGVKEREKK